MAKGRFIKGTKGNDHLTGTSGHDFIVSGRGNDEIYAGAGHDFILAGKGHDIIDGGRGDDFILAGTGDDVVTGGAGDDCVHLGKGDDTAVYVMGDNVGNQDFYHGGKGSDALKLTFTKEEWLRADVQADIAAYLAYLNGETVPEGYWYNRSSFEFKAFHLTAKQFETLEVEVDGLRLNPADEEVDAVDDSFTVAENSTVSGDVLANDDVPDLVAKVELMEDVTKGHLIFHEDGTFTYHTNGEFDFLAVGETATETFTYKVADADGDEDTATVTLTITGENDVPSVSMIDAGVTNEDASTVTIDLLATAMDVDGSDDLKTENVQVISSNAGRTVLFLSDDETGVFSLEPNQFNDLAVSERETLTISYNVIDGNGGVVPNTATFIVEGRNDAPVVANPLMTTEFEHYSGVVTLDLLRGASDVDGDALTFANLTTPLPPGVSLSGTTISVNTSDPAFQHLAVGDEEIISLTYDIEDGNGGSVPQTATFIIRGTNDLPEIISDGGGDQAVFNRIENATFVTDVDATDPDNNDVLSYSISGGVDANLFNIDGSTGVVSFKTAPDFEAASDDDGNNVYEIEVQVADGNGGLDTQSIEVIINDENEAPIAPADFGVSASEDIADTVTVVTVMASDPDVGGGNDAINDFENLSYSIINDASGLFEIDSTTGNLSLKSGFNLDYETATSHLVTVRATDGQGLTDDVDVTVNVTDVNETVYKLLTFDDVGTYQVLSNGYSGLNWHNFISWDPPTTSGYTIGTISAENVLFNSGGAPASFSSIDGREFDFDSAWITGAWRDNLTVRVEGFQDGILKGAHIFTVSSTVSSFVQMPDSIFDHVDQVTFKTFGGVENPNYNGSGTHIAIDNISLYVPSGVDPIILDLGDEGIHLSASANFDINADGQIETIAWTSGEDGILAVDLDGSGMIEDGREIFTPDFGDGGHASAMAALRSLDSNGDGQISIDDESYDDFIIWVDANSDGISQAEEMTRLSEQKITSINLTADAVNDQIDGQQVFAEGHFTLENGDVRDYVAVALDFVAGDEPIVTSQTNNNADDGAAGYQNSEQDPMTSAVDPVLADAVVSDDFIIA